MSPRTRSQLWRTQNAIADPSLAAKLVSLSQVGPHDVVYDLGAGSGVLTAALARRSSRVIAIERDPALVRRLRRRFYDAPNVVVREGDILAYRLPRSDHVVVANPPFPFQQDPAASFPAGLNVTKGSTGGGEKRTAGKHWHGCAPGASTMQRPNP